jgi:transcription initiation factor TFIIH subunit 1
MSAATQTVTPSGRASYKKKDGIISISPDWQLVLWTPLPGDGPPTIKLPIKNVNNLQKTPDSAAKVILKLLEKNPDGGEPIPYAFSFTGPEARAEMKALADALSQLISAIKSGSSEVPQPLVNAAREAAGVAGSTSSGQAAAAATAASQQAAKWLDDGKLLGDITLQIDYLKSDVTLNQTYMVAKATKPDSITLGAFNTQFWSARLHLLRAFLIEKSQEKADYNVLSTIKPEKTDDGQLKLKLSTPQIGLIFKQHPLVLRIYNENVPKLSEKVFWERFFLSKLSKRLRGERVTEADRDDPIFDNLTKYKVAEDLTGFSSKITIESVPQFVDVEANAEDKGGFKGGNRPDAEMRPRRHDDVPILASLNSLSAKLLANVAPADGDPHRPKGMDEATYNQVALRDLQNEEEAENIALKLKDQASFVSKRQAVSSNADVFAKQDPQKVVAVSKASAKGLMRQTQHAFGLDLHTAIGVDDNSEDEDSDSDADGPNRQTKKRKLDHVGSRKARTEADIHIRDGISTHRTELYGADTSSSDAEPMGLTAHVAQQANITHAATVEFLRQFWTAFHSGDPEKATELQYLAEALRKSTERIKAVADDAEKAREEEIARKMQEIRELYQRTKKKVRWKPDYVKGGRKAVLALMKPIGEAIERATGEYQKALAAEGMVASMEG